MGSTHLCFVPLIPGGGKAGDRDSILVFVQWRGRLDSRFRGNERDMGNVANESGFRLSPE
jgi:hypothetical protein